MALQGVPAGRNNEKWIRIFLLIWLAVNWLQAIFTGALFDEHYYWMYAEHPAWGYFDHPPAIAVIIKAGYSILHSTTGIRLFIPVLSAASLYILWRVASETFKDARLFIILVSSIALVHAGAFSATPDVPLIFFAALFFMAYRNYVRQYDLKNAILLSFIIAGLLYSKYHGLLVIFFTLISNFRLFTKKSFYVVILLSTILYLPHILWQVNHDYPTLKYQLSDRFGAPYKFSFTTDFILAQVLFAGAISGILLLYAAFTYKVKDAFERSLKFTAAGVFLIFILSSFRGRVEANWAAVAFIPVIILGYRALAIKQKWRRFYDYSAIFMICIILIFRSMMITNTLPSSINIADEIADGWQQWAADIRKAAGGRPVVFYNSYQRASRYIFYTGDQSYSLNTNSYRKTQFEIWQTDSLFQGKDVVVIANSPAEGSVKFSTAIGDQYLTEIKDYYTYDGVFISLPEKKYRWKAGAVQEITLQVKNQGRAVDFSANPDMPVRFYLTIEQEGKIVDQHAMDTIKQAYLASGQSFEQSLQLQLPSGKGKYRMLISLQYGNMYPGLQSDYHELILE